jgi:hypothetical protein
MEQDNFLLIKKNENLNDLLGIRFLKKVIFRKEKVKKKAIQSRIAFQVAFKLVVLK